MYRVGIIVALLAGLFSFAGGRANADVCTRVKLPGLDRAFCIKTAKVSFAKEIDLERLDLDRVDLDHLRRAASGPDLGEFYEILSQVCNRLDPAKPCEY